ncbi:MAG: hypothetical protein HY741_21940, partial [Chloroflexi bacterium]|nr:hypothetical protein [Chloroflexota bacterium]
MGHFNGKLLKLLLDESLLWLGWFLILLALSFSWTGAMRLGEPTVVALVVTHDPQQGTLFPWQLRRRWRKWAWRHYQTARRAYQRARWAARLARLVVAGTLRFATLVDWLTRAQLRRHLGALPVLYGLLEILQVRATINRYCPSAAELDYGTVALVLILNRLVAPRPLYKVADWLAQTIL